MFAEFYIAHYKNPNNGDTLDYKFHVVDDTVESCNEQAQNYAEWILEEFPQSGFCLERVDRMDNIELGERIKFIVQDMEVIANRVARQGFDKHELNQLRRCRSAIERLIKIMEE